MQFTRNVIIKALGLFILLNLGFAAFYPMPGMGRISAYNLLFPGRKRLPYGDNPLHSYNLSLFNLEAMFASHELAGKSKPADEYRVIMIGDSSTWGFLLTPDQTASAILTQAGGQLADGRDVRVYNLGYPVMSLTKDLLLLSYALRYQPDLIVWPVTLESFPKDKQLFPPLLLNNPAPVNKLIEEYGLSLDSANAAWVKTGFWQRTIIGARRPLADLLRLQIYGVLWAATGIDQDIPQDYTPRQEDLEKDLTFHDLTPGQLTEEDLAFDVIKAGMQMAGKTPVLLINEPMFISQGENSDIRYNFYYPRWAYDEYRLLMHKFSLAQGWYFIDLWDAVPASEFTNSAVHMTPQGTTLFARQVMKAILDIANSKGS
jgi:hypothetical protein